MPLAASLNSVSLYVRGMQANMQHTRSADNSVHARFPAEYVKGAAVHARGVGVVHGVVTQGSSRTHLPNTKR